MNLFKWFKRFSNKSSECRVEHRTGRITIGEKIVENVPMKVVFKKNNAGGEDVSVYLPNIGIDQNLETKYA